MKGRQRIKRVVKNYYFVYTIAFCLMSICVFFSFFVNGQTFIYNGDGWVQHFQATIYWGKYLRGVVGNFLTNGTFVLPGYSFHLGYGADILTTLHYYVIGDPICLLATAVPTRWMAYFYSFAILLRLYLAGITFSVYCFYRKKQYILAGGGYSSEAVGIGALIYVFCGYALQAALLHPFFVNPMIYFPLVLLGIERILAGESPACLVFSVFLSAVSNFYFFYMIVVLTVLYVAWRVLTVYRKENVREAATVVGRITLLSLLGTLMAAAVMLPIILVFFRDARTQIGQEYELLYPLKHYGQIPLSYLSVASSGDFRFLGYAAVVPLALGLLFLQKKNFTDIKIAFLWLTGMLLIPAVGSIMNGFSYASNRWIWGYSMLVAFIVVLMWDQLRLLRTEETVKLAIIVGGYFVLCLLLINFSTREGYAALGVALAMICAMFCRAGFGRRKEILCKILLIICVAGSVALNAYSYYSPQQKDNVGNFTAYEKVWEKQEDTEQAVVRAASEMNDGFFRYSGTISVNSSLNNTECNTHYYWSLSNPYITQFRRDVELPDTFVHQYKGNDNRAGLSTLDNVQYFIQEKGKMFGYTKIDDARLKNKISKEESSLVKKFPLWENQYTLPFGYTYDGYIEDEVYNELTALEKQEAMLQAVVLNSEDMAGEPKQELIFTGKKVPYKMKLSKGISEVDGQLRVTSANAKITLTFDGVENSETYLRISGLRFSGISPRDLYTKKAWDKLTTYQRRKVQYREKYWMEPAKVQMKYVSQNKEGKTEDGVLTHLNKTHIYYAGKENYMVNLGYDTSKKTSITITFPTVGIYSCESLEILCQPMDNYPGQIMALAENTLEEVNFHEDVFNATEKITGWIYLEKPKYLLLTIPYSEGWKAQVDGEAQPLYRANTRYMALYLQPGAHEIELRYRTPGLKAGAWISLISTVTAVSSIAIWTRHDKKHRATLKQT